VVLDALGCCWVVLGVAGWCWTSASPWCRARLQTTTLIRFLSNVNSSAASVVYLVVDVVGCCWILLDAVGVDGYVEYCWSGWVPVSAESICT